MDKQNDTSTVNQEITCLPEKKQEELAKLIESTYAKYLLKRNCILISDVAQRLNGILAKQNFGKVSKQTFLRAPKYFACGYNEKNGACIMLLKYPLDPNFTTEPKETGNRDSKATLDFIERLYISLKKVYKTIDVSETAIQKYIIQNKIILPDSIDNYNKMFDALSKKYGSVIRSNGENLPEERFLILRKTLPVPRATMDIIKKVVAQYFADKDIVSNTEIGQALKNNGINFKDYKYPDLTGFLRSFTELFSIVPVTDSKTGKVQINVRILKDGLDKIESEKNKLFKEKLQQAFAEGNYNYFIEPVSLRTALDLNDAEVWELIIYAIAKIEAAKYTPVEYVTEWEKLAITLDSPIYEVVDDIDFMLRNGIGAEQSVVARDFLFHCTNKIRNFSTIGLRITKLCGEDNILAIYFYQMGLLAGDSADKNFCFRNYVVLCAKYYPAYFSNLWNQYKDTRVTNSTMLYIIGTLFNANCYDELVNVFENMPSKVSRTDYLEIYYRYTKAIMESIPCNELPALNSLDEKKRMEVLASYLNALERQGNLTEYCEMLYLCLSNPECYVNKEILGMYLAEHNSFVASNLRILVDLAKSENYRYWLIINYFIANDYVQDTGGNWFNFTREFKVLLTKRIADATSDDEKQVMIRKAMLYFPNDETFSEDSYEIIRSSIYGASMDKIKGICTNLFSTGNYTILISLYEEEMIPNNESWFLSYVAQCYLTQGDAISAVKVKVDEILAHKEMCTNPIQSIVQLISMVYEGIMGGIKFTLKKQEACLILEIIRDFQPERSFLTQFHIAVMGLAVVAEKIGLYSVLYALAVGQSGTICEEFMQKLENAILNCNEGYAFRVGDFVKTYEYILTTENIDTINFYTKILGNILIHDGFERDYQKYRNIAVNEKNAISITKLFIVDFDAEKSWRLLSKYSNDCGKYGLNYTANLIWLLKFNEKGHPLTNCTRALEHWVDDSLPKNFLINNLYLLRSNLRIDGYWQSFYQHIVENNSFAEVSTDTVDAYFNTLLSKKYINDYECALLISILAQTRVVNKYYYQLFSIDSAFDKCLLKNINCMVRFLALLACEREVAFALSESIDSLRNQINLEKLSEKDRSAIRWINTLFDMGFEGRYDEAFFNASKAILKNYPLEPTNNIVSEKILPKNSESQISYNLITYWINTFDSVRTVAHTYTYLLRRKRSDDESERVEAYRLQVIILRKLIIYYNGNENKQIIDYFRVCKNYLAMKVLSRDRSIESDVFKHKMNSGFKSKREMNALKSYEAALFNFLNQEIPSYIKEEVLYCGITNYWDDFLWMLLDKQEDLEISIHAILEYINVLDKRPLRRRLLQMYLYVNVAYWQVLGIESEKIEAIRNKEIYCFRSEIESGSLMPELYFINLQNMSNLFCASIGELMHYISAVNDMEKKLEYFNVLYFVLTNKRWSELAAKLVSNEMKLVDEVIIPCIAMIQNPKEIGQIIEYLAYTPSDIACRFLESKCISEVLSGFFTNYYYAIYEAKCGNFEMAQNYLKTAGECPYHMVASLEKLSEAINAGEDIGHGKFEQYEYKKDELPQFTFMYGQDPEGVSISQLSMDFYSESGLYDATSKCLIAQKMYYYLVEGTSIRDLYNFIYRWGFYAIDCEYDIERKANILFELLDNIHNLKDKLIFKRDFIDQFIYILNEYEFHIFIKSFVKIMEYYKRLYIEFQPFDDCLCYAELVVHLSRLNALASNDIDTSKVMIQIDEIQKSILAVHAKYPKNYFARKCIEFVDQFKYQIFERGVFEVSILNENNLYDGVVFYQIKNIGFETIPEISLTLYLDELEGTIKRVKIGDEVPGGLRPNQVYAGEYTPNVNIVEGQEIVCILQLEYGDKSYIAIDASSGGKLIAKAEKYEYHKSSFSGYLESTIDSDDQQNFIGRKSEIEEIVGSIVKRQNVLLFGTNGTGKSSILNCLNSVYIPKVCKNMGKLAATINIVSDDGCTEAQVVNGLLDRICSENCMLLRELRKIERHHSDIDFTDTYDFLNDAIMRRKEFVIVDASGVNSSNVIELFTSISSALKCAGIKLFILWDNFEKVISSPNINPKHMSFLRTLRETPNATSNILFVFSGSNYLLEAVSIKQGSDSWNEILTRCATRIKIGNLCYEDFYALMSQERALNNGEIHYSTEAIEYLWKYTNGHAFYSCLLGNRTLEILSSRKVKRRCIYPSDVFFAIYKSDKHMHTDSSDTSKETAIEKQIFQDISNNITVKYVGKTLAHHIAQGATKISHIKLQDMVLRTRPDISEASFSAAIDILRARDFVRRINTSPIETDEDYSSNWFEYLFTSDLYLEHFVNIYVPGLTQKVTEDIERKKKDIYDMLRDATIEDIERLKRLMGTNISGGSVTSTTFESGSTQTNTNIQVNVQGIINTLNVILTAGENTEQLLSGLRDLPRLNSYLPQLATEDNDQSISEERLSLAIDSYVTDMEESLEASYAQIDGQANKDVEYWEILGMSEDDYEEFMVQYDLPEYFLNSLKFAYQLDKLFSSDAIDQNTQIIDYSPVTIMYCKLIEGLLKEYHTKPYSECLKKVETNMKKAKSSQKYIWSEIRELPQQQQQKLTIGSFVFPLERFKWTVKILAEYTKCDVQQWEEHKEMIKEVKEIRNSSAHGNKNHRISVEQKNKITQLLLDEGGLIRLLQIVN